MKFVWTLTILCYSLTFVEVAKQRIRALNSYDPGSCNETTHGTEVLVKDRSDEEILLICVKDKGVYQWKPTVGTKNTIGEFFNPGLHCTDILNKQKDAEDGFYWITPMGSNVEKSTKVFCDMTTDGGGFILIGRQNDSITWTVPSNNKTVEPYGEPHWSSSLGDVPILDFRVQMATSEDFKATKAHWSYRFQSKRPLKSLMMNNGGCDERSAGTGNIAYVKDLLTESIVTTNLRCAKFGHANHPLVKFGWSKMNLCFQRACPWGFAFLDAVRHQVDYNGGFSFSIGRKMSGMEKNATASVGCDNGYCCGCYGPVGGKKDYCAGHCKAINGGTVTKRVFTWFWVRSSLPTRLWKKCMDYQVERDDGKLISYRLVGHSVVPVEGHCSKDSTLLHDGIVVVPDSSTAEKVPDVDGLLEYRKDKQQLYVRSNKTWNALAQENKILQEIERMHKISLNKIKKLEKKLENLTKRHDSEIVRLNKFLPEHKECFGYKWLRENDRNQKYFSGSNCDQRGLSPGWYRFGGGAGTKMPTSCVPKRRCGTSAPGWMNDAHPTVGQGKVTRKVCYHWFSNCCFWSNNIEVVNCGWYYVYKLSSSPTCSLRYCGSD